MGLGKLLAMGAGGWAAWRVFGPEFPADYPLPQERPLRIPGRSVFVAEREFFVRETGPEHAPPLVLIHGWSLDGEMTFHRLVPLLADRYRVIIPDLRNHGRSEWIRGRYEVTDLADEIAAMMEAVGVAHAPVVGYSLGGMVAQELARRHPNRVDSLLLGATAARPVPQFAAGIRGLFWLGRAAARVSKTEGARATTAVVERIGGIDPTHRRWMYEGLMRRDPSLFYEAGRAAVRFDATEWVGRLRLPITVVIPLADQLVELSAQQELAELVKSPTVITIEDTGHEAILTKPDIFADAIDAMTSNL